MPLQKLIAKFAKKDKQVILPEGWETRKSSTQGTPDMPVCAYHKGKFRRRFNNYKDAEAWIDFANKYPHLV